MNNEMMLFQARQDFIDLHKELFEGKETTIERYDAISGDLKTIDDINFELLLKFVEEIDQFDIRGMWLEVTKHIEQIKKSGEWTERKKDKLQWQKGQLQIKGDS
jgi:hypothetical protein